MAQYLYCMADNKIWYPTLKYDDQPLYLQLVTAMAEAIDSGELGPGDRLPPQRHIAWHLDVNLSTVTKAFQQAAKQHLITGEVGRGTYVLGQSAEAELFRLKSTQRLPLIDLSTHIPARKPRDQDLDKTLQSIAKSPRGMGQYLDYLSPRQLERIHHCGHSGSKYWAILAAPKSASQVPAPTTHSLMCSWLMEKKTRWFWWASLPFPA